MKIYCAISFHGFGHLAQSAPILNALQGRGALSNLVIHSNGPLSVIKPWFSAAFEHIQQPTDLGTPMINAIQVDKEETYRQFLHQHQNKSAAVNGMASLIAKHQPDLVLSNNSYLVSRAASQLGIPSFHFCSLNWADNFLAFCEGKPLVNEIYQALCDDYNQAEAFFRLPPHMPMPGFNNLVDIGPVCRTGTKRNLQQHFKHKKRKTYILVSLGGMPYPIDFASWPKSDDLFFINGGARSKHLPHMDDTGLSHIDLITSCDVIITKPGYGLYMEAACCGTPILYLARKDWPEEPPLIEWENQYVYSQEISNQQLQTGDFLQEIERALNSQPKALATPSGINQIVEHLLKHQ